MKITLKSFGKLNLGIVVAIAITGLVFSGCSIATSEDESKNNIQQRDLMIGVTGADVLALHQRYYELMPNDVTKKLVTEDEFGETSQFYTALFQLSQDLEPNGVVGEATYKALENPIMPAKEELVKLKALIPIDEDTKNVQKLEEDLEDNIDNVKPPTSKGKVAYLTFDDGPNPTYTPQILALLKKYNAEATFFALGQEVDKFPQVAKDTSKTESVVANHTYSHKDISAMSDSAIKKEIVDANTAVKKATGKTPTCFRPPYGAMKSDTKQKLGSVGGKTIMWDVDTQDWARPGVNAIVEHVLDYTQDGEIILMHDGGGDRTQTIAALEQILKKMTADGWEFRALDCVK